MSRRKNMTEIKGSEMLQEDMTMLRELRQDIRDLHGKIDKNNDDNHKAHASLNDKLSLISEKSSINKAQIVSMVTILTIIVAASVNYGFHSLG